MEHEKNVPSTGKEMNFFDLCAACGRAIGRGCAALWALVIKMIRLTYRYWWVVLSLVALAIGAAFYYSRPDNLTYKVNAVALLNGPTIPQFEQAFAPIRSGRLLPAEAPISAFVYSRRAYHFDTYRVIDCMEDGTADFIDFKRKVKPTDTINVPMQDRLCLQFRVKARNLPALPEIEAGILEWLNGNPALQQSYMTYLPNLRNEVAFNHTQALKLDSLTSAYYFQTHLGERSGIGDGFMFVGDKKVHLFLDEIYKQQAHTRQGDYRLQLAYAPVVLENHFVVVGGPINGRMKCLVLFILLGWIAGCLLAEIIDKRKAIVAWLKA